MKSEIEVTNKAREESQGEMKTSFDKKVRGLAKKLRTEFDDLTQKSRAEIEEAVNKNKKEINLIQSSIKVSDEKLHLVDELRKKIQRFEQGDDEDFLANFFDEKTSKSEFLSFFDRKFGFMQKTIKDMKYGFQEFMNDTDPCLQGALKDISDL